MFLVKRLPWILFGFLLGVASARAPHVVAQERASGQPVSDRLGSMPTPIPLTFMGVVQQGTVRVAIFSNGTGQPVYGREGDTVLGQYKLLKIGLESVTMSYLDGAGVQTIPMARNQRDSATAPAGGAQEQTQEMTDHPAAGGTGNNHWFFVSDSKTHSCWLSARSGPIVTALAPAPPEACR